MINVKKVVALDENIIYSNCCVCGNELSPYQVERGIALTTLALLEQAGLILGKLNDKPVILLCKKCLELKVANNEKPT